MAKQTVPPLLLPKGWPTRVCPAAQGQSPRMIQRGPYLILASFFALEAFSASFPAQQMVGMAQISDFTFGGPLQQGQRGRRCGLNITYLAGRKHLPIVELKKAA